MPSSIVLTAIFGDMLLAGAALGSFGLAAASFGIRMVTMMVISSLVSRKGSSGGSSSVDQGTRVQLPPSTDNKIPVVYGEAWMKPIITDAKMSEDQQTMWYVLTFSEAMELDATGTFSFGDIYWGDKKLNFDATDLTKVVSWTDSNDETDTKCADKLNFYLYRDGGNRPLNTALQAWEVLNDSAIASENRWLSSNKMTKLVFAIVKVKYDRDAGITGLAEITAKVKNTLNKPGSVIKDYLQNTRYGAGLASTAIDATALTALDTYSDQTITYTKVGGGTETAPRYRINGPINTTKSFLANLNQLVDACDSWLQWNEVTNKWSVVINRSYADLDPNGDNIFRVNKDNIIGGVNIQPVDLNSTYNSIEVQFPNDKARDQSGYYNIDLEQFPNVIRNSNEPDNALTIQLPFTNNIVEAQYIASRRLLQSREDLAITFTMDYSGIQIDAGDVIGVTHERYGWDEQTYGSTGKLFRVNQVQEATADDGTLFAKIMASEYNDELYVIDSAQLQDFDLSLNSGIQDPTRISQPVPPTIPAELIISADNQPTFTVRATIPSSGNVVAMEFWYATSANAALDKYSLYGIELNNASNVFNNGTQLDIIVTGLPQATYVWKVRAVGTRTKSAFSNGTTLSNWNPQYGTITGQNFEAHFSPGTLSVRKDSTGVYYYSTAVARLFGQSGSQYINFDVSQTDSAMAIDSFRIGATSTTGWADITKSNITLDTATITDSGSPPVGAIFQAPTAVNDLGGTMTVPIRYKNHAGEVFQASAPAIQQFLVLVDGVKGDDGDKGDKGDKGDTGEPGGASDQPRTASGYVYYTIAQALAPNVPSAGGFSWDTGALAGLTANWTTTFTPTAPAGGSAGNPNTAEKYWASEYFVKEDVYGGTITVTFSSVFNWINFNGLVTFTNLSTRSPTDATFIDGGSIKTNTITANKITVTDLSSINADLGTITAGTITVGNNPSLDGTSMTGSGFDVNTNGTFALGNAATNITYNGTQLTLNGDVVATGNIKNNGVTIGKLAPGASLPDYVRTYKGNVTPNLPENIWWPLQLDAAALNNEVGFVDYDTTRILVPAGTFFYELSVPVKNQGSDTIDAVYTSIIDNPVAAGSGGYYETRTDESGNEYQYWVATYTYTVLDTAGVNVIGDWQTATIFGVGRFTVSAPTYISAAVKTTDGFPVANVVARTGYSTTILRIWRDYV
jgi:hypothetical protein